MGTIRRILDAVMTSGSAVLTSITAAFVAGDVGKPNTVQGAKAGRAPLTTTIQSVPKAPTTVPAVVAGRAVSGKYAAISSRYKNIAVLYGTWDRNNNGVASYWDAYHAFPPCGRSGHRCAHLPQHLGGGFRGGSGRGWLADH